MLFVFNFLWNLFLKGFIVILLNIKFWLIGYIFDLFYVVIVRLIYFVINKMEKIRIYWENKVMFLKFNYIYK